MAERITIERMDGGARLVIEEPARLALRFFSTDPSSTMPGGYDELAGKGEPDRITSDDIRAINQTMRARSPHSAWEPLTGVAEPLAWLTALDLEWDLFATDDKTWERVGGTALVTKAVEESVGPYRRMSVATKVLHLKRPRLFPVLDSLVIEQIGGGGKPVSALLLHLRQQGQANLAMLEGVQAQLDDEGWPRTLVRILDALLWSTNPTAGLAAQFGEWEHVVRPVNR